MKTFALAAAALGTVFILGASAQATLIARDSFHTTADPHVADTYEADQLMAQSPTVGVFGFRSQDVHNEAGVRTIAGEWSTIWNHTGDLQAGTESLNHNLVSGAMDGRAYTTTGPTSRSVFRALDYAQSGVSATAEAEYYFSFAMATSAGDRIAGMGLRGTEVWSEVEGNPGNDALMNSATRLDDTDLVGITVGFDNTDLAVWINGVKTAIPSVGVTAGDTYFTLVHIVNSGDGNNDVVNVSIYDSSATLDDLPTPFAAVSVTDQDVTGKLWNLAVQKITDNDSIGDGETYFDEFRYGTELSDVVIPEPASLALLGAAGLGLIARRRRF